MYPRIKFKLKKLSSVSINGF